MANDFIDATIDSLIKVERGYTNNPADSGGETNWGITIATARRNGYNGSMRLMREATARKIYEQEYIRTPKFDQVLMVSALVGMEVIDTGANMGPKVAAEFLQRALNVFNLQSKLYPDVKVDGSVGQKTIGALQAFVDKRGKQGEVVIVRCLNSLQGNRYVELAEARMKDEAFIFGWFNQRVL